MVEALLFHLFHGCAKRKSLVFCFSFVCSCVVHLNVDKRLHELLQFPLDLIEEACLVKVLSFFRCLFFPTYTPATLVFASQRFRGGQRSVAGVLLGPQPLCGSRPLVSGAEIATGAVTR